MPPTKFLGIFGIAFLATVIFVFPLFLNRRQEIRHQDFYQKAAELSKVKGRDKEVFELLERANDDNNIAAFYRGLDSKLYDFLFRFRPSIKQDPRILIIEINDPTIAAINMYPLSRDIIADGIILMKEFDPEYAVLDIEFVDPSPPGIRPTLLEEQIPADFDRIFSDLETYQKEFFDSLVEGRLNSEDAQFYLEELTAFLRMGKLRLQDSVKSISRDNDAYLGAAIAYLDKVTATVNMMDNIDPTLSEELRRYTRENMALEVDTVSGDSTFSRALDILPSIMPIISAASTAGFPRVYIDPDGTRRRVDLLYRHEGEYYGQLGFAAWWDMSGRPSIQIEKDRIQIGGASIPLTQDSRFLLPWPSTSFADSFQHLSFLNLYEHDRLWDDLAHNLALMSQQRPYFQSESLDSLLLLNKQLENYRLSMIEDGDAQGIEEYRRAREAFVAGLGDYLNGDTEQLILREIEARQSESSERVEIPYPEELVTFTLEVFSIQRELYTKLLDIRTVLEKSLKEAIVIMGYTGTSTTDIGVNPFEKNYMNVGLYATVINGFIQEDFLQEAPWFFAAIAALFVSLSAAFISRRLSSGLGLAAGLTLTLLAIGALGSVFIFAGLYINILPTFLAAFSTFLVAVIQNFLRESNEKRFIRGALSKVLPPEVIDEIEKDPSLFNKTGEVRLITAMFTDIAGFSSISENLSAQEVFQLLKIYLTAMNEIIFEELGVIDKFEGDAIIAFWGAPLDREDHALRACRAALRMQAREATLNHEFLRKNIIRSPLHTRIGINTGKISVGFLGSEQRSDYTGMGNQMNLASRIEGVNKYYGTSLCISHSTERMVHSSFVTRKLSTVRVVNIEKPVTLYELCCLKEDFTLPMKMAFHHYSQGIHAMDLQNWPAAIQCFLKALEVLPEDGPSKVMIQQCREYLKHPPPHFWDGIHAMRTK